MIIELKNVSKEIKHHVILSDVNMKLESGKIYGFIGRNGSGKTMLMRILTGTIFPSEGNIFVDNKPVDRKKIYYAMGVIIEKPEFFTELTGIQNLKVLASINNFIDEKIIVESMKLVELDPYYQKKVKEYSLGMRQRLGIAQAIMENPDILILDEPTNGLDTESVNTIYDILKGERSKGKLIVISSHHKADIEELCDEIFMFENGCVKHV